MPPRSESEITHIFNRTDVEFIMDSIANGKTYEEVSTELNKPIAAIREMLLLTVCNKIDTGKGLEAYYCNEYNITPEIIADYRKFR